MNLAMRKGKRSPLAGEGTPDPIVPSPSRRILAVLSRDDSRFQVVLRTPSGLSYGYDDMPAEPL